MSEIDPELSATWRAASNEQPPSALDDAIRAAARREVGAKPGRFRAAPRWWPLVAAATVAVVAVGIVQMTPPEQVTPATFPAAMDAVRRDVKPDTDKPMENGPRRDTAAAALPGAQRDMLREEAKPAAKEQRSWTADEKNPGAGSRVGSFAAAPDAPFQEKKTVPQAPARRVEAAPERDQTLKQKPELAATSSVARQSSKVASPPAASAPRNELQPFPATPAPAEAIAGNAPKPMAAAAPPAAPAPAIAARKLAAQSSATGASSGNIAGNIASNRGGNSASSDTGNAEPTRARDAEPTRARDAAALGKVTGPEVDKATPERRKDALPLAPDEWIKRIRRLIADGKDEDAAKELTAFRREYKERSDSLLPSDLRAFRQ